MFGRSTARFRAPLALFVAASMVTGSAALAQAVKTKPKGDAKASSKTPKESVEINSATEEELTTLPGIGEATAKKIIAGRPFTSVDDLKRIGVSDKVIDGLKPLVSVRPAPAPEPAPRKDAAAKKGMAAKKGSAAKGDAAPDDPINLNTADEQALQALPGVGPATAKAIVAGRPYKSLDDLGRVSGLGEAKIAAIKDRVTFAEPAPASPKAKGSGAAAAKLKLAPGEKVNINTASKEELEALPDIGPVRAQAIIDARPFKEIEEIKRATGIADAIFEKVKDLIRVK